MSTRPGGRMAGGRMVRIEAATHTGRVRGENQDAALIGQTVLQEPEGALRSITTPAPVVAAVVDGMGGHAGGREAASVAAETVAAVPAGADDLVTAVVEAMVHADRATLDLGDAEPSLLGLGSVATAVVVMATGTTVVNVGDAPALRLAEDGGLEHLHTEDAGEFGAITQCLGGWRHEPVVPHVHDLGDWVGTLLVASDGLTAALSEEAIAEALRGGDEGLAQRLVDASVAAGAPDNVTVVVVCVSVDGSVDGSADEPLDAPPTAM